MSDYISRDSIRQKLWNKSYTDPNDATEVCGIINIEPSADVRENIHGEWIKIQSGDKDFPEIIVCNKCYHENSHLDFNEHNEPIGKVFVKSNFCPNCGAKMKGCE